MNEKEIINKIQEVCNGYSYNTIIYVWKDGRGWDYDVGNKDNMIEFNEDRMLEFTYYDDGTLETHTTKKTIEEKLQKINK